MSENRRTVPDLWLEQLHLGELGEPEQEKLHALLTDADLQGRRAALERDDAAILAAYPPATLRARIEHRRAESANATGRRRWAPLAILAPAAVAATALVATLIVPEELDQRPSPPEVTRLKGLTPTLTVHRKTGGASERLLDGARATRGDVVQLSYQAAGRPFGVILSLDGRGAVTVHHPTRPGGDTALLVGGEVALPNAYELDDAPDFERFVLVTGATPIDDRAVVRAAAALARDPARAAHQPLALAGDLEQTSVLLRKTAEVLR